MECQSTTIPFSSLLRKMGYIYNTDSYNNYRQCSGHPIRVLKMCAGAYKRVCLVPVFIQVYQGVQALVLVLPKRVCAGHIMKGQSKVNPTK